MIGFRACATEKISLPSNETVKSFDRIPPDSRIKKLEHELSSTAGNKSSEESDSPKQPFGDNKWGHSDFTPPQDESSRALIWPSSIQVQARFLPRNPHFAKKVLFLNRPKLQYPRSKTPESEESIDSWHPDEAAFKSGPVVLNPSTDREKQEHSIDKTNNFRTTISHRLDSAVRPRFLSDGDFSRPIDLPVVNSTANSQSQPHSTAMSNYLPLTLVVGCKHDPTKLSYSAFKSNLRSTQTPGEQQVPLASILSKKSLCTAGTDPEMPGTSSDRFTKKRVRFSTKNIVLVYQSQPQNTPISFMQE